jgi:GNAT superfamily N-acetyltransferase
MGRKLTANRTFLEMTAKPAVHVPFHPPGKVALLRAEKPTLHFYRYLQREVGRRYYWVERLRMTDEQLAEVTHSDTTEIYVPYVDGLIPEFHGRGLGRYLLYHTLEIAWSRPIKRIKVNTCSLDHPRAIALYQKFGFVPVARDTFEIDVRPEEEPDA